MAQREPITDSDLRLAFTHARLAMLGITFQHAIDTPAIRISLTALATEQRRQAQRNRAKPAPIQPALI